MTDTSPVAAKPQTLVWSNPWHNLAFGFGSGLMPKAPGTWGSLVALPFVPLWQLLPGWGYVLMLGLTMLFGVWLCGKVARELGVHDHEGIVWDRSSVSGSPSGWCRRAGTGCCSASWCFA